MSDLFSHRSRRRHGDVVEWADHDYHEDGDVPDDDYLAYDDYDEDDEFYDDEYDDFDDAHRPRRRRGRKVRAFLVLLVCLGLVGGAGYLGLDTIKALVTRITAPSDYPGPGTGSVQIVITEGQSGKEVAATLEEAGVVKTARAFVDAVKADTSGIQLQPGTYELKQEMKAADALAQLQDPASRVSIKIRLREGLWVSETLAEIEKQGGFTHEEMLAAAADPSIGLPPEAAGNLEGYLFPATYSFDPGTTAVQVLTAMIANYDEEMTTAGVAPEQRRDILIRASIVQAEASAPADFPKVARVIQNRLDAPLGKLEFDTTVNYAVQKRGFGLTQDDLATESPYNTRLNKGLPPGPIGSPGAAAIQAALHPADGDWLYFVTVNPDTGETVFTSNYDEFLAAKEQFNQWYAAHH